ncbi:hypothetical protein LQR30_18565 [Chromobacterium piscinae]|uniref:hypothetical protein n=1 Tax=Chromobacterium piscinae TaxID=686831 RepID=UPI001E390756|nr:hypothetical protein [Chromobacterium piscinae]MCD4506095.1 hypothetical protein [Chromobacterium piscinae]
MSIEAINSSPVLQLPHLANQDFSSSTAGSLSSVASVGNSEKDHPYSALIALLILMLLKNNSNDHVFNNMKGSLASNLGNSAGFPADLHSIVNQLVKQTSTVNSTDHIQSMMNSVIDRQKASVAVTPVSEMDTRLSSTTTGIAQASYFSQVMAIGSMPAVGGAISTSA